MASFGRRNLNPALDKQTTVVRRDVSDGIVTRSDEYEEPFFARIASERPWPAVLVILIPLGIAISTFLGGGISARTYIYMIPGLAILSGLLFLNFRSMQKGFAEERDEREFQSKHFIFVFAGMFAGLLYFMFTQKMGIPDILAMDWSSAFSTKMGSISDDEPLTMTLFGNIAAGGAIPYGAYALWKRLSGTE